MTCCATPDIDTVFYCDDQDKQPFLRKKCRNCGWRNDEALMEHSINKKTFRRVLHSPLPTGWERR